TKGAWAGQPVFALVRGGTHQPVEVDQERATTARRCPENDARAGIKIQRREDQATGSGRCWRSARRGCLSATFQHRCVESLRKPGVSYNATPCQVLFFHTTSRTHERAPFRSR